MPNASPALVEKAVNTIRMLSADMVQQANSGHPGMPMGAADMAFVLWTRHLRFDPDDPRWLGRDRFLLSGGHGSALLDAVQARARGAGFATLWLEVRASNERARRLYAQRGFAEVGLRRGYYPAAGGREDAVLMSLALPGQHGLV